jgi:homogentisate 1,2-dioxygenase
MLRRSLLLDKLTYSKGSFGAIYQSEALEGSLPRNQNSPQKVPYGLHTELLSGTSFTMPRCQNRYSWLYRIRPSVQHVPQTYVPFTTRSGTFMTPPFDTADFTPEAYRFKPRKMPSQPTDFIDGLFTVAGNGGGPVSGDGAAAHIYAINDSMNRRVFRNHDGDMLFIPQEGAIVIKNGIRRFGDIPQRDRPGPQGYRVSGSIRRWCERSSRLRFGELRQSLCDSGHGADWDFIGTCTPPSFRSSISELR